MKPPRIRSFRARLLLLVTLASVLSSLLVAGSLVTSNILRLRREAIADLEAQADIIALNAAASLAFHDMDSATALLEALSAKPHIASAVLFDEDGVEFARVETPGVGTPPIDPSTRGCS